MDERLMPLQFSGSVFSPFLKSFNEFAGASNLLVLFVSSKFFGTRTAK